ncbi:MAG TPA: efflux RND transporter periplasmic adaptor subunit [Candidatus Acidoferrales bacterium]|nr:efflux RND transporter periplasmic adaptor subunit [Candidatus Acidoferrales bacterium]
MEPSSSLFELATVYYSCRDTDTLLKTFAGRLGTTLGARGVLVWLCSVTNGATSSLEEAGGDDEAEREESREESTSSLACRAVWLAPGERFDPAAEIVSEGLLTDVLASSETLQFSSEDDKVDLLAHFAESARARVKVALYAALPGPEGPLGVVEVLNPRRGKFSPDEISFVEEACRITGLALENRLAREKEQHDQLATVERLTALYDISRIFNSTLEIEELLPVVVEKIRDILSAEACNLWLVDAEAGDLYAVQQAGEDPTLGEGARCPMGEGVIGQAAQTGQPRLVENAHEEELLAERQKRSADFQIESLMCAPLLKDQEVVGAVEVINRLDGGTFTEEDLYFLTSISEQAAIAIHNANLLEAERKVSVLDALLNISREITSTLDLDHVLTTVVHQASTVVPSDRFAIGLFDRDRFLLGAVSGEKEVPKTREMTRLREIMEWVARREEPVAGDQYDDGWHCNPEEVKERAAAYLEEQGYSGFYALPLRDDQGALGAIALLNGDAEFLNDSQRETLAILANQTSVAIRNAQLYQQVPLAGFLKPFAERKEKILAKLHGGRWVEWAWHAAVVTGLLIAIPWPMRIGTNATVVPGERRMVTAQAGGIVERVLVHEGSMVLPGQALATLDSSADRVKLAEAETSLSLAQRDMADAEYHRDPSAAGEARLKAALYQAQVNLEQKRVDAAQLFAPISGVVVTPKVEQKVGTMLAPGDAFCELVDQEHMAVEMNVPETDLPLLRAGKSVAVKLNALPTKTIQARVERIGVITVQQADEQFFVVRADFTNPDNAARDGMVGGAKILAGGGWFSSGWYPVGYVLFRTPARWGWEKVWSWLP